MGSAAGHRVRKAQPVGRSIAPELASALALADQLWNIGLGATEVARPVGAPH